MASSSKGKTKRKRIVLSVDDKLKICEMVRKKIPKTEIMLKYNIGASQQWTTYAKVKKL